MICALVTQLALLAAPQFPSSTPATPPTNLGVAVRPYDVRPMGSQFFFVVLEADQGATDLNGDGDTTDAILFDYDAVQGTLTNWGFAIGLTLGVYDLVALDPFVAFQVSEADQPADLNGDGDLADRVVHVLDTRTGQVFNLGEGWYPQGGGVFPFPPEVHGNDQFITLPLRETNSDLNGDGDMTDFRVVASWSPQGGLRTWPLQGLPDLVGSEVRVAATELFNGDFNGDGDQTDSVLHRVDLTTGAITNLGIAGEFYAHTNLLSISETQEGVDLDGDGLVFSSIAFGYDPVTGAQSNLGVRTRVQGNAGITYSALPVLPDEIDPSWIPIASPEGAQDLDGDGTLDDFVLQVWDESQPGVAINLGTNLGGWVLWSVYTDPQTGQRTIVAPGTVFYDELGNPTPLPFASGVADVDGPWLALIATETTKDLNGDLDLNDQVVIGIDQASGRALRHGWSTTGDLVAIEGSRTYAFVEEEGTDLNGDGDGVDWVLHAHDASTRERVNVGLAAATALFIKSVHLEGGYALAVISEADQGNTDLNGDGDTEDSVLFIHGPQL